MGRLSVTGLAVQIRLTESVFTAARRCDRIGTYTVTGLDEVEWHIQKTLITSAEGEVVATFG